MSDAAPAAVPPGAPITAGAMLRSARQAQGLHIAALAASIKVSQRKLELLEADRISELPDATFARALAQTVCRSLKIDATAVLAALPQANGYRLDAAGAGINTPFRDRPGRHDPPAFSALSSPAVWIGGLIAAATLFVVLLPTDWVAQVQTRLSGAPPVAAVPPVPAAAAVAAEPPPLVVDMPADLVPMAPVASAASMAVAASAPLVETVHSVPDAAVAAEPVASGVPMGPLQLKATEESWIEVIDGRAQVLVSRHLLRGEVLVLDGVAPFKLKVGNAAGTELVYRGQVVNLSALTRDNVARLELK